MSAIPFPDSYPQDQPLPERTSHSDSQSEPTTPPDSSASQELDHHAHDTTLTRAVAPDRMSFAGLSALLEAANSEWDRSPSPATTEADALPLTSGLDRLPPSDDPARYTFIGEIARGGMGVVWRCHDGRLKREVALKVLHDSHQKSPELVARFSEEGWITGRLRHPGIVPVHDVGRLADGRPFIAMQWIQGRTLAAILADRTDPNSDLPYLLNVFEQVCQALAYAHAQGVIHRDLKPTNILIGPFGVMKVVDWGLAKRLHQPELVQPTDADNPTPDIDDGNSTLTGSVMGTPSYMPPEQALGHTDTLDERCDVFSLGAILCEILTGRPPYEGTEAKLVLQLAKRAEMTEAFARLDGCHAARDLIVLTRRCLAADATDRPRDAGVLARQLTEYLESVLRQAERDLVRFFDLSLDLFCIAGFDGFFHRINGNFSRVLGYTTTELLASPFFAFVHPDDQLRTQSVMGKLSQGLPVVQFRNRYRDIHGEYRWFEWTAKSVPGEDVIFAVARDVTDQVALETKLRSMGVNPVHPSEPEA